MTCKNCGAQLAPEEKFCGECGAPVIQQVVEEPVIQEEKNVCSNCGAQLEAKEKFCSECGTPVTQQVEEEPTDEEPEAQEQAESFETNTDTITKTENINNHSSNKSKKSFITICILSIALFCSIVTSIVIYQSQEKEMWAMYDQMESDKLRQWDQLTVVEELLVENLYEKLYEDETDVEFFAIAITDWAIYKHHGNKYDFNLSYRSFSPINMSDINVIIEQYENPNGNNNFTHNKISETKVDKSLIDFPTQIGFSHKFIIKGIYIPDGNYTFTFRFLYHGKDIGWVDITSSDITRDTRLQN